MSAQKRAMCSGSISCTSRPLDRDLFAHEEVSTSQEKRYESMELLPTAQSVRRTALEATNENIA